MTTLREAAQQALEALTPWMDSDHTVQHAAYHALRAALAQQAEPTWVCPDSPEHRYAKPGHCEDCGKTLVPLYTAPPQRKPLTEEEIERICMTYQSPRQAVRAVERAHGIGGQE